MVMQIKTQPTHPSGEDFTPDQTIQPVDTTTAQPLDVDSTPFSKIQHQTIRSNPAGAERIFKYESSFQKSETLLLKTQEITRQLVSHSPPRVSAALELLAQYTDTEWAILANNAEVLELIASSLATGIDQSDVVLEMVTNLFMNADLQKHDCLKILVVIAFVQVFSNQTELLNSFEPEIFFTLNRLQPIAHKIPSSNFILMILDTLKTSGMSAPAIFLWCQQQAESKTTSGKTVFTSLYRVMEQISPGQAKDYFFSRVFAPLERDINPRENKKQVHNSYYSHVGAAEVLARIAGQRSIAIRHHINQENNEWGRILEENIRTNEVLLLDMMGVGNDKIGTETYDPTGILQKNLAFVHVLRVLFHKIYRVWFDPLKPPSAKQMENFLDEASLAAMINTRIPANLYQSHPQKFDDWLIELKKNYPEFLAMLEKSVTKQVPQNIMLPVDVFFMEINETEFYQYDLEPTAAMPEFIRLISMLRSWTSGYHGRYLTRISAFFDQNEIQSRLAKGESVSASSYYSRYAHLMSRKRFELSILPILTPSKNQAGLDLWSRDEALALIEGFEKNSFHHYLPGWLLQIIDHRFFDKNGQEDFLPMQMAFDLLSRTPFSRDQMRSLFQQHGFIGTDVRPGRFQKHQTLVQKLAWNCLKKMPPSDLLNAPQPPQNRHQNIDKISPQNISVQKHAQISNTRFTKLEEQFVEFIPAPGSYRLYKQLAKQLLASGNPRAISLVLEAALSKRTVSFPKNAPLAPLIPGPIGQIVTHRMLNQVLANMTTVTAKRGGSIFFSNLLLRWARQNGINLAQVLSEALSQYTTPQVLKEIQDQIVEIETSLIQLRQELGQLEEIKQADIPSNTAEDTYHETLNRLSSLEFKKQELEQKREKKLTEIKIDPLKASDQALFQIINSIYNAIRKQYLKQILIAGRNETAVIVEAYLREVLIPKKNQQMAAQLDTGENFRQPLQREIQTTQSHIDFLFDVLVEVEQQENKRQAL